MSHGVPSEDIVVGVMWSGADRTEYYRNKCTGRHTAYEVSWIW